MSTSHGAIMKIDVSSTMTAIPGIKLEGFNPGELQLEDVTNHDTVDATEYEALPIRTIPPVTCEIIWNEANAAHTEIENKYKAGTAASMQIVEKNGDTVDFSAFITKLEWMTPVNGVKRRSMEFQINGGTSAALTYS